MFGTFIRVIIGFTLACLVAGLAKVLFAFTPMELSNMAPEAASDRISLALPVAVHQAIFAAPLALLAIIAGETQRWRDWAYYALAGVVIALLGFAAQFSSESATQGWSVTSNTYPFVSYLTTGFVGGIAYWLVSGRHAGGHHHHHGHDAATAAKASGTPAPRNTTASGGSNKGTASHGRA